MSTSGTWSAQRDALAAEVLRRTGRLRMQVRGESMLPALWPGDVAEIARCSLHDVGRGEIVLAFGEGRFFLHRLLSCQGDRFISRGDSMPRPDPAFAAEAFLGKLVGVIRNGQTISAMRASSQATKMLFRHSGFVRRLALKVHASRNGGRTLANLERL